MGINVQLKGMDKLLKYFTIDEQAKIVLRTVNKVIDRAFTEAKRDIRTRYNLKVRQKEYKISKLKADKYRLWGAIKGDFTRLNIVKYFGATQSAKGLKYKTLRSGGFKIESGGFIAQPSGRDYSRRGQRKKVNANTEFGFVRMSSRAYPLAAIKRVSFGKMVSSKRIEQVYKEIYKNDGQKEFNRQCMLALQRGGA